MSFTGADFPDYNRLDQQTSTPIIDVVAQPLAADFVSAGIYVGAWGGIQIKSPQLSSPPGWTHTFEWFTSSALTKSLGKVVYRSGQGHPVSDVAVNLGPYLRYTAHATSYAGNPALTMLVVAVANPQPRSRDLQDGVLLQSNANVASGAFVTFGTLRISTGRAYWQARSAVATNWKAFLTTLDETGTTATIGFMDGAGGHFGVSSLVLLPAYEIQVIMQNTDAAVQNLQTSLVLEF